MSAGCLLQLLEEYHARARRSGVSGCFASSVSGAVGCRHNTCCVRFADRCSLNIREGAMRSAAGDSHPIATRKLAAVIRLLKDPAL